VTPARALLLLILLFAAIAAAALRILRRRVEARVEQIERRLPRDTELD
jgi:hypothetical protein